MMPQMGESIAEGTIVRWIKKVGDPVDRDEPLFEISTDKVDAEIPRRRPASSRRSAPRKARRSRSTRRRGDRRSGGPRLASNARSGRRATATERRRAAAASRPAPRHPRVRRRNPAASPAAERNRAGVLSRTTTPATLVAARARIAKEHNVDISQIRGTGIAGRVTKDDILGFIGSSVQAAPAAGAGASCPRPNRHRLRTPAPASRTGQRGAGRVEHGTDVGHAQKIAEHMVASRRTSAHVHSVFEVNFSQVAQVREAKKAEFERAGAKLTYLSFILKAAVERAARGARRQRVGRRRQHRLSQGRERRHCGGSRLGPDRAGDQECRCRRICSA